MKRPHFARSAVHSALWVDAAFELVAGAAMLTLSRQVAGWLNVDRTLAVVAGLAFLAAAVAISVMALRQSPGRAVVSGLAALNLIGGVAVWSVVAFKWSQLSPEGRWLVSAVADSLVAVALLEFLALWRTAPTADSSD